MRCIIVEETTNYGCMLLIDLFQWICRVKRRGGKQGFNEDWTEMEWKTNRKIKKNSAKCKLFASLFCK